MTLFNLNIKIIVEYLVYEADAIQMVSSKSSNCEIFLTADRKLVKVARSIGINAFDVEKEGETSRASAEKTLSLTNRDTRNLLFYAGFYHFANK